MPSWTMPACILMVLSFPRAMDKRNIGMTISHLPISYFPSVFPYHGIKECLMALFVAYPWPHSPWPTPLRQLMAGLEPSTLNPWTSSHLFLPFPLSSRRKSPKAFHVSFWVGNGSFPSEFTFIHVSYYVMTIGK